MAAATPNNLSPATSIHPLVAEMPLEDLKLNNDLKLWTMSYFCCEILALQHAVLILAANRNLNQSGSSHGSISTRESSGHKV